MSARYPAPPVRRLRVYAFDPQSASGLGSVNYAYATIALPWEEAWEDPLEQGPVNDYLEVIDVDPASGQFYKPIDLNDANLLAQDGLTPSEGNPQFHQQMVFAVAMKVIKTFERALGRKVTWAPRWNTQTGEYEQVQKLRVYPHALREANAYYSMQKKALLFGYFQSANASAGASWIFTALSHDIIAHETTHAVLDGLHRRYAEATSVDSLAFHEAFADIVALLSHFTLTEAVHAHIQQKGGDLDQAGVLSGLAEQFAVGTTGRSSLRQYVGVAPDPGLLAQTNECHDRGAILVAAVFDAFLTIYVTRTDDLLRIGKVTRSDGKRLDPDLANRLTREAVKAADHVLRMCIRALDYMPPVDVRFGEFLRGIITADADLVQNDPLNYRLAFSEAFRRRGILATECLSMSPDNLLWEGPEQLVGDAELGVGNLEDDIGLNLRPQYRREDIIKTSEQNGVAVFNWLSSADEKSESVDKAWEKALGIYFMFRANPLLSIFSSRGSPNVEVRRANMSHNDWMLAKNFVKYGLPKVEVHSVRTTRRAGPDGQDLRQLVIEVTQRRRGYFDKDDQATADRRSGRVGKHDFVFRGGATMIFDLKENALRYVIRKRVDDDRRLQEQRDLLANPEGFGFAYRATEHNPEREPFAMLHRRQ